MADGVFHFIERKFACVLAARRGSRSRSSSWQAPLPYRAGETSGTTMARRRQARHYISSIWTSFRGPLNANGGLYSGATGWPVVIHIDRGRCSLAAFAEVWPLSSKSTASPRGEAAIVLICRARAASFFARSCNSIGEAAPSRVSLTLGPCTVSSSPIGHKHNVYFKNGI